MTTINYNDCLIGGGKKIQLMEAMNKILNKLNTTENMQAAEIVIIGVIMFGLFVPIAQLA